MVVKTIVVCGKTRTAIIAIKGFLSKNKNKKIVVVVPTEHLKIQWMQELAKVGIFHDVQVEIINSAAKVQEKIDFLILDEAHRVPGPTFFEVFKNRDPSIVLGLSATFERLDGRHELLNQFCPVCDIITIQEAIANKWLSPYKEYKVLLEVDDIDYYRQINSTFLSTFSFFNNDFNLAMECVAGKKVGNKIVKAAHFIRYEYAKSLCTLSKNDPRYDSTIKSLNSEVTANAFTWNRALQDRKSFVMNHLKKIEVTRQILIARPFSKSITFSATIAQAEKIGGGFIVHSGKTKKKNRLTVQEFSRLKTGCIHSSKALMEGIDIEGLNLAIILCGNSSATAKTQTIGRVIRYEEGKEAEVFTLVLRGTMEENWYSTATAGKNYIEINEEELTAVLAGVETSNITKEAVASDLLFRL